MENTNTKTNDVTTEKPRRRNMSMVKDAAGAVVLIASTGKSVEEYLDLFNALDIKVKQGYDNYWSVHHGFTNPTTPAKLTVQGIGKMMAVLTQQAAVKIAAGGPEAEEMEAVLTGITEYAKTAAEHSKNIAAIAKMRIGLKTLMDAFSITEDKALEILAQQGLDVSVLRSTPKAEKPTEEVASAPTAEDDTGIEDFEIEDINVEDIAV